MKTSYEPLAMQVIRFATPDILTTSTVNIDGQGGENATQLP